MNKETYNISIALVCSIVNIIVCFSQFHFLTDETIVHNLYGGEPFDIYLKLFISLGPILAIGSFVACLLRFKKHFDEVLLHAFNFIFLFFMLGVLLKILNHGIGIL